MAILKYLDISTSHVPVGFDNIDIPFRRVSHEYGWIIFLKDELEQEEIDSLINEGKSFIIEIWKLAKANDSYIVNLDADADVEDGLEVFDWKPY